ncbi:hypothetical protein [Nonomuraea helvata]|uniref:ABC transporter ATP-binding protein n=1 Tax=Nonomuraea helvata TaxID=37484 RepID=A0ABV5S5J6_9ACTN
MTVLARAIEVSRRYGDVLALDRLSLDIKAGELVGCSARTARASPP